MCGYYLSSIPSNTFELDIQIQAFNSIKHRGIDYSDYKLIDFKDNKIFIGHHRLSINDLHSRSNQPFVSQCNNYYLLFNGEIFNYKNLKNELVDYNFISNSDTEVILAGYIKEGTEFFKKLEGFYAITIVDLINREVISTIDPTAVKPLYYKHDNSNFLISSETTSIISDSKNRLLKKELINPKGVQMFMQFGYIHAPYSIYENIYKLEPGELIHITLNNNILRHNKNFNKHHYKLCQKDLESLLIEAHKSRLISDVPIATFLSSGVDSTLSNTLLKNILIKNNEKAYTVGIDDPILDESKKALLQTKKLNLIHEVVKIDKDNLYEEFIKISKYLDEPFGDSSALLVSYLSKIVSQNYKVSISSDGGDELLYGYQRHKFYFFLVWLIYFPKYIRKLISFIVKSKFLFRLLNIIRIPHLYLKINKMVSFIESDSKFDMYLNLLKITPDSIAKNLLSSWDPKLSPVPSGMKNQENLVKFIDHNYYLPSINYKNDRCGMQHSLEIREPLLNFELVRSYFQKKFRLKDFFYSKSDFRSILKKYKIIIKKSKHGFSFSQSEMLKYKNFKLIEELNTNINLLYPYFNTKKINEMTNQFKIDNSYTSEIWLLVTLSFWIKNNQ